MTLVKEAPPMESEDNARIKRQSSYYCPIRVGDENRNPDRQARRVGRKYIQNQRGGLQPGRGAIRTPPQTRHSPPHPRVVERQQYKTNVDHDIDRDGSFNHNSLESDYIINERKRNES